MRRFVVAIIASWSVAAAGCGESAQSTSAKGAEDGALADYEAAAKADSWRDPTEHGTLRPGGSSGATLAAGSLYHAWGFELSGEGKLDLAIASTDRNLDTVMYLYRRDAGATRWGRYLAKNDDHGDSVFSRIERSLDAGEYRVIVKGFKTKLRGAFTLSMGCEGAGCARAPEGPGAGEIPQATPFTTGCADRLVAALGSPLVGGDFTSSTLKDTSGLGPLERLAVEDYAVQVSEWASEEELAEVEVDVSIQRLEDATIIDVTEGSDWSYQYAFDGAGVLLMRFFHDQSPDVEWYCGRDGEPVDDAEAPGEWCAGAFVGSLPHDHDAESEVGGAVDDDAPMLVRHAASVYRKLSGLDADAPVAYDGRTWSGDWREGAEITVKSPDAAAATYLLGGEDSDPWVLAEATADRYVARCLGERDL